MRNRLSEKDYKKTLDKYIFMKKKLKAFWTMPTSPWHFLNVLSKIIVTRRVYGRIHLNFSWLHV